MQSQEAPRARRVHDAQLKSQVLAECQAPGASIAAVALAHGLNANLVRNWLRGRGLQRAGLALDAMAQAQSGTARAGLVQFVPLGLPERAAPASAAAAPRAPAQPREPTDSDVIEVHLRGGARQMTVRWPVPQAVQCTQWLRELAAAVLGGGRP